MFNRSYQLRSRMTRKTGLVGAGEIIQEMVERAAVRQEFYRPARRVSPVSRSKRKPRGKMQSVQLELFPAEAVQHCAVQDPARPLFDLFPEAYQ
jgi:hypothetical protein